MKEEHEKTLRDALRTCQEEGKPSLTISASRLADLVNGHDALSEELKSAHGKIEHVSAALDDCLKTLQQEEAMRESAEKAADSAAKDAKESADRERIAVDNLEASLELIDKKSEELDYLGKELDDRLKALEETASELQSEKEARAQLMADYNSLKSEYEEAIQKINITIAERDAAKGDGARLRRELIMKETENAALRDFIAGPDGGDFIEEIRKEENPDTDSQDTPQEESK